MSVNLGGPHGRYARRPVYQLRGNNKVTELPQKAIKAVERIVIDIQDRHGLRQEWDEIDEGVQGEIMVAWVGIIVEECGP